MRKTALLLTTLALMFPVSIIRSYGPPSVYPKHFFEVSLADDYPIQLSPEIHFLLVPNRSEQVARFDGFQALGTESFTLSLGENDWTPLPSLEVVFICPSN
jgi:hypothetical protein